MDGSHEVLVVGAGPAGLTATYSLSKKQIPVKCFEADSIVGGISRTIEFKGYRFDIGGHRFFTKIQQVNDLWYEVLGDDFLRRPRVSRIYYNGKFFNYPLRATNALVGLGLVAAARILLSYLKSKAFPRRGGTSFETWVSNRFGAELYNTFFKTYTEKVWGIPCTEIQAEWAAQRIKGLSLYSAVMNALFKPKHVIKTLIDEFNYPRFGPGQMYATMAQKAIKNGAELSLEHKIVEIHHCNNKVEGVMSLHNSCTQFTTATHFISTMPITSLILSLRPEAPAKVVAAARDLKYRSLLTVNLLIDQPEFLPDTWIYVHDSNVRMGRIQCFANWSPDMVPSESFSSRGLEYFCWEGGRLWSRPDDELVELGKRELAQLGLVKPEAITDGFVIRMAKCYPVYDSDYPKHIAVIKAYLSRFDNLHLCGRYGLFKYNNMDHSILTALMVVENILGEAQHDVWAVNADDEYHEELGN